MDSKIKKLSEIAEIYDVGLSHFFVKTLKKDNSLQGTGSFADEYIPNSTTIAIIGGLLVNEPDKMISMPIGEGLYINQVNSLYRATINHSCKPTAKITGFNKLISITDITKGEEITIDYGSISAGSGKIIINDCLCKQPDCRSVIRDNDYLQINNNLLSIYPRYVKEYKTEGKDQYD